MKNVYGIFEHFQSHYDDNELIKRVTITSSNVYDASSTNKCGGCSIYKNPVSYIIQKNPEGCFHSGIENCWIIIDLKTKARISSIGMKITSYEECTTLQGFYFLGSNDGLNWKNISHFPGPFKWVNFEWMNFSFSPATFKYFQIYQDPSTNDRKSHHFHLGSLELYGELFSKKEYFSTNIFNSFHFFFTLFELFSIFIIIY